jgi:DeoR family transcriptional regulator, fructose operon transcriptional repressor
MGVEGSLAAERRQQALLDLLRVDGRVDITVAAERLDVHPMTVRRDLKALERDGSARLVRGGAIFVGTEEFDVRRARALSAKRRIAEKLSAIVQAHESIGLDASTTVLTLAESMPDVDHLLVVTYGIDAFRAMSGRAGLQVLLSGGELDPRTGSLVGPVAQRTMDSFSLDCCILSTTALDPEIGTMEPTVEEVGMKQSLARAAERVVLALDSTKLGQRSAVRAMTLDQVTVIVTELDPADERLDPYRDRVELL